MNADNAKIYAIEEKLTELAEEFGGEIAVILKCAIALTYKARMVLLKQKYYESETNKQS